MTFIVTSKNKFLSNVNRISVILIDKLYIPVLHDINFYESFYLTQKPKLNNNKSFSPLDFLLKVVVEEDRKLILH